MTTQQDELKLKVSSLFEERQILKAERDEQIAKNERLYREKSELLGALRIISKYLVTDDGRIDSKALNELYARLAAPSSESDSLLNYQAELLKLKDQNKSLRKQFISLQEEHANLQVYYQELASGQDSNTAVEKDQLIALLKKYVKDCKEVLKLADESKIYDYYQLKSQKDELEELNKAQEARLGYLKEAAEAQKKRFESEYASVFDEVLKFWTYVKEKTDDYEYKTRQMDIRLKGLEAYVKEVGYLQAQRTVGEDILAKQKQQSEELARMANIERADAFDRNEAEKKYRTLLSKTEALSQSASGIMKKLNRVIIDCIKAGVYDVVQANK